ncbi:hypothetical protein A6R68_14775 [Neotoma lepida]|uniref:Uncharacterized protein n=1 Tax=Neotoma lepida TaxID=56216 RepID=A0A1A6HAQ9_NEOLE|nr:hypothetical protein A6R68_14775 [Neotoma lepida]
MDFCVLAQRPRWYATLVPVLVLALLQSHISDPGPPAFLLQPGPFSGVLGPLCTLFRCAPAPPQAELSCVLCLQRRRAAASG